MNRQDAIRIRKSLKDALTVMQSSGLPTTIIEREVDRIETIISGDMPKRNPRPKWSGIVYEASDGTATNAIVTSDGDVIVGSSTAREQEAYDTAIRILSTATRALAREMRRHFTYHETKFAIRGAAWFITNGAARLVWEATHDEQSVVPKQEDDRDLKTFTFVGDEPPPRQERPHGRYATPTATTEE